MNIREGFALLVVTCMMVGTARAQERPTTQPAGGLGAAVEREARGLVAEDFPERDAALKRLQQLIGAQVRQRAEIQAVMNSLQEDLARQQRALAAVTDEEAHAQIAGLLELERGIAGWTIETMGEPMERRKALLNWGLSKEAAPTVAQAYSHKLRVRLEGIKQLAKLNDETTVGGASWTLARLINDPESAVRAAAMAACWDRKPNTDIVGALWFRAVNGPVEVSEARPATAAPPETSSIPIKVDFPGGDPLEFEEESSSGEFLDSQLAGDVLVHLKSPLVAERIRTLVEQRSKTGKDLVAANDPDWTLVTHRLVETYGIKEAIPMLAAEALSVHTDEVGGNMNGRAFTWSHRTVAIGTLSKLIGKDPADFQLLRAQDMGDPRGWIWAVEMIFAGGGGGPPGASNDGTAVRPFFAWWSQHHAEYGVKEEPSSAGVPPERPRGRRGRGGAAPAEAAPQPATAPAANAPASRPDSGGI